MPPAGLAGRLDHDALLAAVIADPDSDTPRLVYADYLEEAGDEADAARAEFIRMQCSIAERERIARQTDGAEWLRTLRLAQEYEARWQAQLPHLPGVAWRFADQLLGVIAWRGFPMACVSSVANWHCLRARLVAAAPMDCVRLRLWPGADAGAITRSPLAGRLRVLAVDFTPQAGLGGWLFEELAALTRTVLSGDPSRWRGLVLNALTPEIVTELSKSMALPGLEWLRLPNHSFTPTRLRPLLSAYGLPRLAWVQGFGAFSVPAGMGEAIDQSELDAAFADRRARLTHG